MDFLKERKILIPTFSLSAQDCAKRVANEIYKDFFSFRVEPQFFKGGQDFFEHNFISERSPIVAWGIDRTALEKSFFLFKKRRANAQIEKIFSQKCYPMPQFLIKCEAKPLRALAIVLDDEDICVFDSHRYMSESKLNFIIAYLEGHNGGRIEKISYYVSQLWPRVRYEVFSFNKFLLDALKIRYKEELEEILFVFRSIEKRPERDRAILRYFPNALIIF